MNIIIRPQKLSDAQRFFEILNNQNFLYFGSKPKSLEDERAWLRKSLERKKTELEYNYAILMNDKIVGGIGVKIDYHARHIGEIGFFVDEAYWGKGIAPAAVKMLERICFDRLRLIRVVIKMNPKNKASQKVAIKCGYKKEGRLRKDYMQEGILRDSLLYAKVKFSD